MAPEQVRGEPITPATDVYSLGILAQDLLPSEIPEPPEAIIQRCLRSNPAARHADASELDSALSRDPAGYGVGVTFATNSTPRRP
jgi:serine/threonine protein kinase